jgi:hypothetical protein
MFGAIAREESSLLSDMQGYEHTDRKSGQRMIYSARGGHRNLFKK